MFGIGTPELIVIVIVALIVLGPERMPEIARTLGKGLAELRKATSGLTEELQNAKTLLEGELQGGARKPPNPPGAVPHAAGPQPAGPPPEAPQVAPNTTEAASGAAKPTDTERS